MNKEVLFLVKSICDKEFLSEEKIFEALESALSIAIKKKYFYSMDIRVVINRKDGNFSTFRRWIVVKNITQPDRQIILKKAQIKNKNVKLNDFIQYKISAITLDHINIQAAKKIIISKVNESKQLILLNQFYNKIGRIIVGVVKSIKKNCFFLSIQKSVEAIIDQVGILPTEHFKIGDHIKGVICSVYPVFGKIRLLLSRSNTLMLIALLKTEVPEIKTGLINIKSISRDPGYRSKVAVYSNNCRIDPIGACIGIRGHRIQFISKELKGERIDIILWNSNLSMFVRNLMAPIDIYKMVIISSKNIINVFVDSQYIPQLIGKNGQNIRLSSQLISWSLNVFSLNDLNKKK